MSGHPVTPGPVARPDAAPPGFVPVSVGRVELTDPAGLVVDARPEHRVRLLVRLAEHPLGFVEFVPAALPVSIDEVRTVVAAQLGAPLARALAAAGLGATEVAELPTAFAGRARPFGASTALAPMSVVISTRERPESLRRCLRSFAAVDHPGLEIVVVDNAAATTATRDLLADEFSDDPRIRYVAEPRPGLSFGRNCGLAAATHDLVAYTDDDVEVDALWTRVLAATFAAHPDAGCVTGLVPTAELESPPQQHFDRRVSWSSNCEPRRYTLGMRPPPNAAFPFGAGIFGTGANFAVRRSVMTALGGFDTLLGAGAPTKGGEDLDAFARILLAGHALVYEPAAVVWHHHRVAPDDLKRQLHGYGLGLSAYITKLLTSRATIGPVLRRVPAGVKIFVTARKEDHADDVPVELGLTETYGFLAGPFVYLRARLARRLRRSR